MTRRPTALALGVVAALVGLAAAVRPSLLGALPAAEVVVGGAGAVALAVALSRLAGRRSVRRQQAPDPEPEAVPTVGVPGDDLDRLLVGATSGGTRGTDDRHRLRRELREAAVRAVRRREDCDVATARAALEDGTWTDDPLAASYFTRGAVEVAAAEVSLSRRLLARVSERERQAVAARRVATVVADARTGVDEPADDELAGASEPSPGDEADAAAAGADR